MRASTAMPARPGSMPDASRARARRRAARRPVATSSLSPRSSLPSAKLEHVVAAVAARRRRVLAEAELDAVGRERLAERFAERRAARAAAGDPRPRPARPPRPCRASACAISTPTGPPPSTSSRRGTSFRPVASRLVHTPSSSREARDRRDDRVGAGGDDDVPRRCSVLVADHARRRGRRAGPSPRSRSMPVVVEPRHLAGVGVVGDHEVAPGERRRDVDRAGHGLARRRATRARPATRLAGAQQRLRRDARPVGALAGDQLALDDRDPQAAVGELAGAVLAGRPAADDDDVVVGSLIARSRGAVDLAARR